jgi:hypothetical protein
MVYTLMASGGQHYSTLLPLLEKEHLLFLTNFHCKGSVTVLQGVLKILLL